VIPSGASMTEARQILELSIDDQGDKASAKLAEIVSREEHNLLVSADEKISDVKTVTARHAQRMKRLAVAQGGFAGLGFALYTAIAMPLYGIEIDVVQNIGMMFLATLLGTVVGWMVGNWIVGPGSTRSP